MATVAINGAVNAALLSAEILALEEPQLAEKLMQRRRAEAEKVLEKNARIEQQFNI